jgi:hypothetical protein
MDSAGGDEITDMAGAICAKTQPRRADDVEATEEAGI